MQPAAVATTRRHRPIPDFARAIRDGTPPMTSLDQARVIQQITDAVYESARTGAAAAIG